MNGVVLVVIDPEAKDKTFWERLEAIAISKNFFSVGSEFRFQAEPKTTPIARSPEAI